MIKLKTEQSITMPNVNKILFIKARTQVNHKTISYTKRAYAQTINIYHTYKILLLSSSLNILPPYKFSPVHVTVPSCHGQEHSGNKVFTARVPLTSWNIWEKS